MGLVPPRPRLPRAPARVADANGALLILDEVISGFRVARGGAQERSGVDADLTVLGKVIGGGLPAAAYGGPRELMQQVAPAGDVYQAGTLSGNPLAIAAGLATLRRLDLDAYGRLARSPTARRRPARAPPATPRPGRLSSRPAHRLLQRGPASRDFAAPQACDPDAYGGFCRAMLDRGVYPPPSQFEAWFPSLAHGDEEIEADVEAAAEAFAEALA